MGLAVVVAQLLELARVDAPIDLVGRECFWIQLVRAHGHGPERTVERDVHGVYPHDAEHAVQPLGEVGHALRLGHRRAEVQRERATRRERRAQLLEELHRVERRRRAHRVVQIQRDQVEALLGLAHELHPVVDQHAQLRVVEDAVVHRLEVLLGDRDDVGVDLDHGHVVDRRVLERLFRRAAVAAADDQHLLRLRMGGERGVDEVLVVDELLLLGGHVEPVETEQLAVVRRLVDLHLLELGLPLAELFARLDIEAGGRAERLHQQVLAAVDLLARDLGRLEEADDGVEQAPRLGGVVGAVVADIDVERQPLALGPGVDREVRLGEHDAAGEAAALELVEGNADRCETRSLDHLDAL